MLGTSTCVLALNWLPQFVNRNTARNEMVDLNLLNLGSSDFA